eukprot:352648-Chlamydomonas_euryale.AAC.9
MERGGQSAALKNSSSAQSMKAREEDYRAAREKILGSVKEPPASAPAGASKGGAGASAKGGGGSGSSRGGGETGRGGRGGGGRGGGRGRKAVLRDRDRELQDPDYVRGCSSDGPQPHGGAPAQFGHAD